MLVGQVVDVLHHNGLVNLRDDGMTWISTIVTPDGCWWQLAMKLLGELAHYYMVQWVSVDLPHRLKDTRYRQRIDEWRQVGKIQIVRQGRLYFLQRVQDRCIANRERSSDGRHRLQKLSSFHAISPFCDVLTATFVYVLAKVLKT